MAILPGWSISVKFALFLTLNCVILGVQLLYEWVHEYIHTHLNVRKYGPEWIITFLQCWHIDIIVQCHTVMTSALLTELTFVLYVTDNITFSYLNQIYQRLVAFPEIVQKHPSLKIGCRIIPKNTMRSITVLILSTTFLHLNSKFFLWRHM